MIFIAIGIGLFAASIWEILRALKTGRLRLRVSSITRESHPGLFWSDIAACAVTAVLAVLFAVHFAMALWGRA